MKSIFLKEINSFFSSLIGYIVIGVFLLFLGLWMWFFPDSSLLNYNYATLDQLFELGPMIFLFLIPAITMRSISEENATGTIELLLTKPLTDYSIVIGKFLANVVLVIIALLPTLLYYYTIYQLGAPKGNLDSGAIMGSYFGLILLASSFVSIGIFSSAISKNQIVAFLLALFLSFFFYWGFDMISRFPLFLGTLDDVVESIGMDYHYRSMSRGLIDSRDLIYFLSLILFFIFAAVTVLKSKKQ